MIQSYLTGPVALTSNTSSIAFERDCVRTRSAYPCGGWLCHSQGSPIYKITKGGNYRISFDANVTSATAGYVAIGLFADGVLIPGATAIAPIGTAGVYTNISIEKVLPVCCCSNATLTVQSIPSVLSGTTLPGTATTTQAPIIQNANIIVEKEC